MQKMHGEENRWEISIRRIRKNLRTNRKADKSRIKARGAGRNISKIKSRTATSLKKEYRISLGARAGQKASVRWHPPAEAANG